MPGVRRSTQRRTEVQIRPLGGAPGCLMMLLVSLVVSVVLTVTLNLLVR